MAYMTAQIAYEAAMDYTRQRQAFGRPVAGFQVTRHKLVDMAPRSTSPGNTPTAVPH